MISFVRILNSSLLSFDRQRLFPLIKKNLQIFWSSKHLTVSLHQERDFFHLTMNSSSSLSILNSYYDTIVEDLVSTYSSQTSNNPYLQNILSHFKTVLNYNISDGKKLRGTTVIDTVRAISSESTDQCLLKQAAILGWCIELIQGSFLVADDLMDHSLTRRGKTCWYLKIKDKESAVNDAFYLYSCTFTLLKKYFPTDYKLYYLFNEVFQRTVIGQGLDLETPSYLPSIDLYTEEHYYTVVTWKTAYYTIVLPIFCGLSITPLSSFVDHPELKSIAISIGIYFQVQDDYLDCYGDVNRTGKIGTDIQERKCSWLIVQAIKLLKDNDQKREILRENYGYDDPMKIQYVKDIYQELNLQEIYQQYEEKTYQEIFQSIHQANFNSKELEQLLIQILNSIYARNSYFQDNQIYSPCFTLRSLRLNYCHMNTFFKLAHFLPNLISFESALVPISKSHSFPRIEHLNLIRLKLILRANVSFVDLHTILLHVPCLEQFYLNINRPDILDDKFHLVLLASLLESRLSKMKKCDIKMNLFSNHIQINLDDLRNISPLFNQINIHVPETYLLPLSTWHQILLPRKTLIYPSAMLQ